MSFISTSTVVGTASSGCWSQVHSFVPSGEKLPTHGSLLLALSIKSLDSDEEGNLAGLGKEIISRFQSDYYQAEIDPSSCFEHLRQVVKEIAGDYEEYELEAVAGVVVKSQDALESNELYVAAVGGADSFLERKKRIYQLLKGSFGEEGGELRSAGGRLEGLDMLLLATSDFLKAVSLEKVKEALVSEKVDEASLMTAPLVQASDKQCGAAGLIVKLEEERRSEDSGEVSEAREEGSGSGIDVPIVSEASLLLRKISSFPSKIGGLFGRGLRVRGGVEETPDIRVKEHKERKVRLMYSVALVLLLLLFASIFFGSRHRLSREREKNFNEVWEVVEHQYQEAVSLAELNPLRSRALLLETRQIIETVLNDENKKLSEERRSELEEKLNEVERAYSEVSGEHKIEEAERFLDLTLVRPDTSGDIMAAFEDTIVVLDRKSGVLLRVNASTKSAETVGGGSFLTDSLLATVTSGRGFVLSGSGVVEVSLANKTSAIAVENDPEWGNIVDMGAFSGNLYLLDKGQSEIFRYPGGEGGFGRRDRWLGEGVLPDLTSARSMAIDGDIWVLTDSGILRFRRGVRENYSISGLDKELSEPVSVYTDANSERIYILDRGNRRVVVFDKSGEYRAQYLWEGIDKAEDLVVSEAEGKIFLLNDELIYAIDI